MKPQHAGTNYKTLLPFFRKMKKTGQNIFDAHLGGSSIIIDDLHYSFNKYGAVYRIGYTKDDARYFEIAIDDINKTATPLRYIDRNAVSLDNSVPDLTEVNCFWFSWKEPCARPDNMRRVDTLLWEWLDYLIYREFYGVKYC